MMIGPLRIQKKRFWFASPFGPHILVWLLDRARRKPQGFARYTWNWRGQAVGVRSSRDFEKHPIVPKPAPVCAGASARKIAIHHLRLAEEALHCLCEERDQHAEWAHDLMHQAAAHLSALQEVRDQAAEETTAMFAAGDEVVKCRGSAPATMIEGESKGV